MSEERDYSTARFFVPTDWCKLSESTDTVAVDYPVARLRDLIDDLDALERGAKFLAGEEAPMPPVVNVHVKGQG